MSVDSSAPHQHRPEPVPGSVIVGLSGTPAGRAASQFAADYAVDNNVALHCFRAWRDLDWLPSASSDRLALAGEFAPGDVHSILQARSSDAALLVVGGAGTGDAHEAFEGSIGGWLREHCPCPVAVIDSTGRFVIGEVPTTPLTSTP